MRAAAARNVLKAWALVLLLAGVFAGLGWLIADLRGATLFAFCSALAASAVYAVGDRVLLGQLGARVLVESEEPALRVTVARVAGRLGIPPPRIALVRDGFPRAFVVGRGPHGATLGVSSGLLAGLAPGELEAVLAHELAHVRTRDVLTQTLAAVLATTLLELTRVGGWLSRGLLAVLAPVAAAFTHVLLSPKRELAADALAASVADPDDLADALLRLDRAGDLVVFEGSPATEPLFTVSPFDDADRISRMFVTHPPVADRVAALRRVAVSPSTRR
jgi:heat shock protein HtpX